MRDAALRKFLTDGVFRIAESNPDILSLNIVGSFADTDDLSGISDIDTVIIVDYLTEWKYNEILARFADLAAPLKAEFGLSLKINHTFGPLKYNEPDTVVYHVMIYDVARHILHCRNSPFTCYDWQRTRLFAKSHIADIYAVGRLSPGNFFSARRSAREYLADYEKSVVSYRYYRFVDGEVLEEKAEKSMADKDKYEFAFHILRFIMNNFLKMLEGRNVPIPHQEALDRFTALFPSLAETLPAQFWKIHAYKAANSFPPAGAELDGFVRAFLSEFEKGFHALFPAGKGVLYLARHHATALNDGRTFLGRRLDPPSVDPGSGTRLPGPVSAVFSSPARRALETAARLAPGADPRISPDLQEIDYGGAEGNDVDWLARECPGMLAAWARGEDPQFPGGECHADVLARVDAFLAAAGVELQRGSVLAVTHNVWLRCMAGRLLGVEPRLWHRIRIPHGEPLIVRPNPLGGFLLDIPAKDVAALLIDLETEAFLAYQGKQDPHAAERHAFWKAVHADSRHPSPSEGEAFPGTCLIPMAGEGSRFAKFGFRTSKPLIQVQGEPMIYRAVRALPRMGKYVYLMRNSVISPEIRGCLERISSGPVIVPVDVLTEGQACTCLLGIGEAPAGEPLLIAPCDNGMQWDREAFAALVTDPAVEVVCWTFTKHLAITAKPEAWGYVAVDGEGNALDVSVKKPFTSDPYREDCVIGTFWFRTAGLFRELAEELVRRNLRVNNEFYVDSVIGLAVKLGRRVKVFRVDKYLSWGKPEDLFEYRKWMEMEQLYGH